MYCFENIGLALQFKSMLSHDSPLGLLTTLSNQAHPIVVTITLEEVEGSAMTMYFILELLAIKESKRCDQSINPEKSCYNKKK